MYGEGGKNSPKGAYSFLLGKSFKTMFIFFKIYFSCLSK